VYLVLKIPKGHFPKPVLCFATAEIVEALYWAEPKYGMLSEAEVRCTAVVAVPERSRRQEPKSAKPKYDIQQSDKYQHNATSPLRVLCASLPLRLPPSLRDSSPQTTQPRTVHPLCAAAFAPQWSRSKQSVQSEFWAIYYFWSKRERGFGKWPSVLIFNLTLTNWIWKDLTFFSRPYLDLNELPLQWLDVFR
jgi:hypothetical protein